MVTDINIGNCAYMYAELRLYSDARHSSARAVFPSSWPWMVRLGTYLGAVRESTSEVPLVLLHVHKDVYSTDTLACQDGLSAVANFSVDQVWVVHGVDMLHQVSVCKSLLLSTWIIMQFPHWTFHSTGIIVSGICDYNWLMNDWAIAHLI